MTINLAINIVVLKKNPISDCKSFIIYGKIVVTNATTMEFIHLNVHSWLVMNLYLTPSLISIHF
jgi:hypothetical protein